MTKFCYLKKKVIDNRFTIRIYPSFRTRCHAPLGNKKYHRYTIMIQKNYQGFFVSGSLNNKISALPDIASRCYPVRGPGRETHSNPTSRKHIATTLQTFSFRDPRIDFLIKHPILLHKKKSGQWKLSAQFLSFYSVCNQGDMFCRGKTLCLPFGRPDCINH